MKTLGIIINPIAGMGGRVGLKGSDGGRTLSHALKLGAVPESPKRAVDALRFIQEVRSLINIITCSYMMGEDELNNLGIIPDEIIPVSLENTTFMDTREAAKSMFFKKADLILFAGGDGTARDIVSVITDKIPILGIPAGVKIHSAVYARTPRLAGIVAKDFLMGKITRVKEAEVMDIDEDQFRKGIVTAKLYGYGKVPFEEECMQGLKSPNPLSGEAQLDGIADMVIERMENGIYYIIGPGTTTRKVMNKLGLPNTLLGVDVIFNKKLIINDTGEKQLLSIISGERAAIIITPIGGQGCIFGRGNQQISPAVINLVGRNNITVISTREKLSELHNNVLSVDTGDEATDDCLKGYYRVLTGYSEETIVKCI